jgi:hypothetical protein
MSTAQGPEQSTWTMLRVRRWAAQTSSGEAFDLGALGGTRTPNLLIRSQMLYPLSYERQMATLVYDTHDPG